MFGFRKNLKNEKQFNKAYWEDFYRDIKEKVPPNAQYERGLPFQHNGFVCADNVGY